MLAAIILMGVALFVLCVWAVISCGSLILSIIFGIMAAAVLCVLITGLLNE